MHVTNKSMTKDWNILYLSFADTNKVHLLGLDCHRYGGLDTPEKRASVAKWIFWANATLDPVLFKVDNAQVVGTNAETNPKPLFQLNGILEGKRYLVNDEFSVADVAVSSYLLYVPQFFPEVKMGIYPNIVNYMARCLERETFVKAFGEQTKQLCVAKCQEYLTAANCTTTS